MECLAIVRCSSLNDENLYKDLENYSDDELEIQQKIALESAKVMEKEMRDLSKELEKTGIDLAEEIEAIHARPDLDAGEVDVSVLLEESSPSESFSEIGIEYHEDVSIIEEILEDAEIIGDLPEEIEFE